MASWDNVLFARRLRLRDGPFEPATLKQDERDGARHEGNSRTRVSTLHVCEVAERVIQRDAVNLFPAGHSIFGLRWRSKKAHAPECGQHEGRVDT